MTVPGENGAKDVVEPRLKSATTPVSGPTASTPSPWCLELALQAADIRPPDRPPSSPLPFFHLLGRLKSTKREGWRHFGINDGESISDHMYRMSILTMLAPPSLARRLDVARCTKMALVHDMAESLVGDITPADGVPKPEKSRREAATMAYLTKTLLGHVNGGAQGRHIKEIWDEYEYGRTLESQFVHDVDKIELLLQMVEYERAYEGSIRLNEFVEVGCRVILPEMQQWRDEILQEQTTFWKERPEAVTSSAASAVAGRSSSFRGDGC